MTQAIWQPSDDDIKKSHLFHFLKQVNDRFDLSLTDYSSLHQWSVKEKASFWQTVSDFCGVNFTTPAAVAFQPGKSMRDAIWFEGATLNFAEQLLSRDDDHIAIHFAREDGHRESISYKQLKQSVYALAIELKQQGIKPNDRIAGFLPNCPDTVIAMLATTLIGATWTSCSPDFGFDGVVDRFSQIEPRVLFAVNSHQYNGKQFDHSELLEKLQQSIPSIERVIFCDHTPLSTLTTPETPTIEHFPFDHPTYILYSSGTTGKPKCMVHGAGGTLLQHKKELMLHSDLHQDDTIFFYTTCGWMMWNWLVSSLAVGATLVLFDGSPFSPKRSILFDLIDELNITHFGVGAKFLESAEKFSLVPKKHHHFSSLRCILTTGSPLLPNSFDFVYNKLKPNVQLSSISGGSDIISCFALGNPTLPVYRGELQCIGLGMDVHIFDDEGNAVIGEKGELVCTSAFPSRPLYFWNDAKGEKYQRAYFDHFNNIWAHGDYAEITTHQGMIIYGRSDATLNPRGVRIGTAEIYRQVEKIPEVFDSVAVGKLKDGSEEVVLLVILTEGITLDSTLTRRIKKQIRDHTSPLHVPTHIIQVPDLPRTVSGKTVELAVKKLINNEPIKNTSALANPECLDKIQDIISPYF